MVLGCFFFLKTIDAFTLNQTLNPDLVDLEAQSKIVEAQSRNAFEKELSGGETHTSLVFPPTHRVNRSLNRSHSLRTRYKPRAYSSISPNFVSFDKMAIASNDKPTFSFQNRPTEIRYDEDNPNWFAFSKSAKITPGLKYSPFPEWKADTLKHQKHVVILFIQTTTWCYRAFFLAPRKGFSIGRREPKPAAIETAGKDANVANLANRKSLREAEAKNKGAAFGLSQRFGNFYC